MIGKKNDIIEFETCVKDAFYLLRQAADMVEKDQDHRKMIEIKRLIETRILCHEPYVHNTWLKKQVRTAWEILDDYADKADASSY